MLRIMRDPDVEPERRDKMAAAAALFVHPRFTTIQHSGEMNHRYVARLPPPVADVDEWMRRYAPKVVEHQAAEPPGGILPRVINGGSR